MAGLKREASASTATDLRFDTLYLGGGTPSLLDGPAVAAVRDLARAHFPLEIAEFTLEANPSAGAAGRLRGWREAGVSRLSVGVQSFDDDILRTLGRRYSGDEALRFCRSAREAGFEVLAVDLMVGVPGETAETVGRTLDTLLELGPDHVSVYFLENVEGLPFAKVLAKRPVDEDEAVDNYESMRAGLEAAGLLQYEISNFARPGRECRHNLKYWRYEPYAGLGPSACSHVARSRWCNRSELADWAEALDRGGSVREDVIELDPGGRRTRGARLRPAARQGRRRGRSRGADGHQRVLRLCPGDRRARLPGAPHPGRRPALDPGRQAAHLERHFVSVYLKRGQTCGGERSPRSGPAE